MLLAPRKKILDLLPLQITQFITARRHIPTSTARNKPAKCICRYGLGTRKVPSLRVVVSHPRRKNKDAPRMGHPAAADETLGTPRYRRSVGAHAVSRCSCY